MHMKNNNITMSHNFLSSEKLFNLLVLVVCMILKVLLKGDFLSKYLPILQINFDHVYIRLQTIKMLRYYDYYYCFYHKHKNKLIKLTLKPHKQNVL